MTGDKLSPILITYIYIHNSIYILYLRTLSTPTARGIVCVKALAMTWGKSQGQVTPEVGCFRGETQKLASIYCKVASVDNTVGTPSGDDSKSGMSGRWR